jgi:DNA-binding transcriptional MocR family regulator
LAERICIAPGPIFSPKRKFKNCFRLNCSNPWSAEIEQAVRRLGEIMGEMRGKSE